MHAADKKLLERVETSAKEQNAGVEFGKFFKKKGIGKRCEKRGKRDAGAEKGADQTPAAPDGPRPHRSKAWAKKGVKVMGLASALIYHTVPAAPLGVADVNSASRTLTPHRRHAATSAAA